MKEEASAGCENCKRLEAEVLRLQEQLAGARKDSSTSSKPPSSDLVKPAKPSPPGQGRRRRGGQPGHPKHERALFGAEQVNAFFDHHPAELCPDCGQALVPSGCEPQVVQQVDLRVVPLPLHIEEHRCHEAYCRHCDHTFRGAQQFPAPANPRRV
jgi:transposase